MLEGRREELERIGLALDDGRPVLVSGAAGIGKSALVAELLSSRNGVTAQCSSPLRSRPFHPLSRAFGWASTPDTIATMLERTFAAMESDALLVIEDVQWADPETLELATAFSTQRRLVMTTRVGEPGGAAARGLISWMGGEDVELGPLAEDVIIEILRREAPTLVAGERREVLDRCGGNALVANLLAYRLLNTAPRDAPKGQLVGGSAEAVLLGVVAELPAAELEALALLGSSPFPTPHDRCPDGADLVARGLATESCGHYEVVDGVLAELAWGLLDEPMKRSVHLRLAELAGDDIARARHLLAAGELGAAGRLAALAAAGPITRSEQAEALSIQAIAELGRDSDGIRPLHEHSPEHHFVLVLDAAAALNDLGDFDGSSALLEAVLNGRCERGGLAGDAMARQLLRCAAGREDREFTSRAVAWARGGPDAEPSAWISSWTGLLHRSGAGGHAERLSLEAMDVLSVDQSVDRKHLAFLRAVKAYGTDPEQAVRWLEVAADEVSDSDPMSDMDSTRNLVMLHLGLGNWGSAINVARRGAALARAHGATGWVAEFKTFETLAGMAVQPCTDDAIGWLSWVRTAPTRLDTRAMATSSLATVLVDRGAIERSGQVLAAWSDPGVLSGMGPFTQAVIVWAMVQRSWVLGDLDEVIRVATWATDSIPPGFPTLAGTQAMWRWAEYESGRPIDSPDPQGGLLPCAALESAAVRDLADGATAAAVEGFEAATEAWSSLMLRSELRCRWATGLALVLDGRRELGAEVLESLDTELDAAGVPALRPRVAAAFRLATGRELAGVGGRSASMLSSRQQEVLLLVGEGLSTAQIARRLGLTADTVNSHVRHAMRKLGARTRVEAAAAVGLDVT